MGSPADTGKQIIEAEIAISAASKVRTFMVVSFHVMDVNIVKFKSEVRLLQGHTVAGCG